MAPDGGSTRPGLYDALCEPTALRAGYERAAAGGGELPLNEADRLIEQLGAELAARAYQSAPPDPHPSSDRPAIRDAVVCWTVRVSLEAKLGIRPADTPDPGAAAGRLADAIGRGLTAAYVVDMAPAFTASDLVPHLDRLARHVGDPELVELVRRLTAAPGRLRDILAPVLAEVGYEGIDAVLEQAAGLGKSGTGRHLEAVRRGHEVVVLADGDTQHAWLMPATQTRLHTELAGLRYSDEVLACQSADLFQREPVRAFGHEFRAKGPGRANVSFKPLPGTTPKAKARPDRPRRSWRLPRVSIRLQSFRGGAKRVAGRTAEKEKPPADEPATFVHDEGQMSDGHTGTATPASADRAANRAVRRIPLEGPLGFAADTFRKAQAVQVRPEHLVLGPVLAARFARRRWADLAVAGCGLAAVACVVVLTRDVYANLSGEAAAPNQPPGFYVGQVQTASAFDGGPTIPYGLYLPPHFRAERGPFPLVVYLHAYGERTKDKVFAAGLPKVIADKLGEHTGKGRFEFAALFPVDPTGRWEAGSPEVEDAMRAMDYVVRRHNIDPTRICLTGWSNGGMGVWNLTEAYPDRWAATAPVSSFSRPRATAKLPPAWVFHGGADKQAPVQGDQEFVAQMREAGAEVQYTEYPKDGHNVWAKAYADPKLYEWLARKHR